MFGFLKANPAKKLEKTIARKRVEAVGVQRDGDLRAYASLNAEIRDLEDQLIAMLGRQTLT
jgi:hypothetical protein